MTKSNEEYKGHRIELEPFARYCSRFRARVFNPEGEVIKTIEAAGDTEEHAFDHARRQIDFEEDLAREQEGKKALHREPGLSE